MTNTKGQFFLLAKNALGLTRTRRAVLYILIWFGVVLALLIQAGAAGPGMLLEDYRPRGTAGGGHGFGDAQAVFTGALCWWLLMLSIPALSAATGGTPVWLNLEFLLTRAINRRTLFRAETVAGAVLMLGPFILNLLVSPVLPPRVSIPGLEASVPEAEAREVRRYTEAFPGSIQVPAPSEGASPTILLRHGAAAFAGWVLWLGAAGLIGVQAYFGWMGARLRGTVWVGLLAGLSPMFLPAVAAVLCARHGIDLYERGFLFFKAHWVALGLGLAVLAVLDHAARERKFCRAEI